jgi:AcrR family transcriptional regulator
MLTALATRYVLQLEERLTEVADKHAQLPPLERLIEIGMTYVEFGQSHPALFSLTSSPDQIDIHDAHLSEARERAWTILRDVVYEAQQTGWRADQPTEGVALTCWVLVHGSAALWREGWLTAQFPDAAVRELVRSMFVNLL